MGLDPNVWRLFAKHRPQFFLQRDRVLHPLICAVELQEELNRTIGWIGLGAPPPAPRQQPYETLIVDIQPITEGGKTLDNKIIVTPRSDAVSVASRFIAIRQ